MSLNAFAVPQYRIVRSSAKISELPTVTVLDNGAKFLIAHNNRNWSIEAGTIVTVVANAVLALGGGTNSFDPLLLPINTATQNALNQKAAIAHTHQIEDVNGLAAYVTSAINLAISGLSYASINHTHSIGQITGLQSELNAKALASDIPPILAAIAALDVNKANSSELITLQNSIISLNALLQNKAEQSSFDALSAVVDSLINTVNGKANTLHGHTFADVAGLEELQTEVSLKADAGHQHGFSDVTGLPELAENVSNLYLEVQTKANSVHMHSIESITGLAEQLAIMSDVISNMSTRIATIEANYVTSGAVQW